MVAFVDNHLPVLREHLRIGGYASETLHRGDVDDAGCLAARTTDRADALRIDVEKLTQASHPLFDKQLAVHQDERRPSTERDQPHAHHGLARSGRRTEHADVPRRQLGDCARLWRGERAGERRGERRALRTLVRELQCDAEVVQEAFEIVQTAAGQRDVNAASRPTRAARRTSRSASSASATATARSRLSPAISAFCTPERRENRADVRRRSPRSRGIAAALRQPTRGSVDTRRRHRPRGRAVSDAHATHHQNRRRTRSADP